MWSPQQVQEREQSRVLFLQRAWARESASARANARHCGCASCCDCESHCVTVTATSTATRCDCASESHCDCANESHCGCGSCCENVSATWTATCVHLLQVQMLLVHLCPGQPWAARCPRARSWGTRAQSGRPGCSGSTATPPGSRAQSGPARGSCSTATSSTSAVRGCQSGCDCGSGCSTTGSTTGCASGGCASAAGATGCDCGCGCVNGCDAGHGAQPPQSPWSRRSAARPASAAHGLRPDGAGTPQTQTRSSRQSRGSAQSR